MPLRVRVACLFLLLGLVMSMLFAVMVNFIAEDYEDVLVEEILRSQADDYARQLQGHAQLALPRSRRLSAWLRRRDGSGEVPSAMAALAPGIHESPDEERDGLHMAVFDIPAGRLFFCVDLSDIERLERHVQLILLGVIVFGSALSAWLGWLLSGAVVDPVRRLADAVDALPVRPAATTFAEHLPRDELGRLGRSIDDYQARLLAAEENERAFFADASHELRTPIAVVRGATELLMEDGADLPGLAPRLQRLARGMAQLSELLDALLGVARHKIGPCVPVVPRDWLEASLRSLENIRDGTLQLRIAGSASERSLPTREAELVVRGVVRRMVPAGGGGCLEVELDECGITMQFSDGRNAAASMPGEIAASDRRLGMTLIGRLAEQIGWWLDDAQADAGRVVIRFADAAGFRNA